MRSTATARVFAEMYDNAIDHLIITIWHMGANRGRGSVSPWRGAVWHSSLID